jgi:excisionase family DNA binding protein
MHRRLHSDMRENPASNRRHGPRLTVGSIANDNSINEENLATPERSSGHNYPPIGINSLLNTASTRAATVGEEIREYGLLTVHEVADLLQVPVSWVYGHTRARSVERLPGFRLGKYWRFRKADLLAWLRHRQLGTR